MMRNLVLTTVSIVFIFGATVPCVCQTNADLFNYFQQYLNLNKDQIAAIQHGEALAKNLEPRVPAEVFLFGVVRINANPESYLKFAYDFDRMRSMPEYLAIEKFGEPPQLSDLNKFSLTSKDVTDLKDCKPDRCEIQVPASGIREVHQLVNWSASDVEEQVNRLARKKALQFLLAYQQRGNEVLGVYNDKHDPVRVAEQFKYMLSYTKVLPKVLPHFYNYLLEYPKAKPENVKDMFYWANVKFGLKPTLRLVQVVTMKGNSPSTPTYTIAEKQLYSSHYFETALNLTYCISSDDLKQPGFYLIMIMGSEQAGLTGVKGSIVRRHAVGRSVSSLQKSLKSIKKTLEHSE